jgi:hypothetical protein
MQNCQGAHCPEKGDEEPDDEHYPRGKGMWARVLERRISRPAIVRPRSEFKVFDYPWADAVEADSEPDHKYDSLSDTQSAKSHNVSLSHSI